MNLSRSFSLPALSALLLSLVASLAIAQSSDAPAGAKKDEARTPILTRVQFDQLLAEPEQLLIIDIRRPDEVTAIGGLPVYLSVQVADLDKSLAWIPKDRKIVTISNHAGRPAVPATCSPPRASTWSAVSACKIMSRMAAS